MPEIKSCPTCSGNAYSTPYLDGTRWCAAPGRSEVHRLRGELTSKESYVEHLENRAAKFKTALEKIETIVRKNDGGPLKHIHDLITEVFK